MPGLSVQGGRKRAIRIASTTEAEAKANALAQLDGQFICWGEPTYPQPLAAIADPPQVLQVLDHAHLLVSKYTAIVVAHNASAAGRQLARDMAAKRCAAGLTVVSGLSLGVLMIEAAPRLGSLITTRMAPDLDREVFAVPCSRLDPRYKGTNGLIRQGAVLTESAADVLDVLNDMIRPPLAEPETTDLGTSKSEISPELELDRVGAVVGELLGPVPVTVDELLRECQLSPAVVLMVLLELELAGRLERQSGNRISLRP